MKRSSGILLPIFSLYGDYSCGNFGRPAYEFVDFLSEAGFRFWQILPLCITDEHNSPYMSYSSFGGNPLFIDPEILYHKGLITDTELQSCKQNVPYSCEYDRLNKERIDLLKKASSRVTDRSGIEQFLENNPKIASCCMFMALKETNNGLPWNKWTKTIPEDDILKAWQFIQYEFSSQWQEIHEYAASKGIEIIGDIPFYVAFDSCDVWQSKEDFLMDENDNLISVAGVPPDYFSEEGQLWGNPVYNWEKMKADCYSWWKDRLRYSVSLYDGIRIDHFRAISEFWSIPGDARSAKEGKWEEGPGKDFIKAIKEIAGSKLVIAENLGIIDGKVDELLDFSGFPGMSVFQFGFDGNYNNPHLIHNYKQNLVAYTGTHDNNTLLGFMWEQNEEQRKNILEYIGYTAEDWNSCYESILREMLMSNAATVILPIQDILGFGSDTRYNTPGRPDGNWCFRITEEQFRLLNRSFYFKLNQIYSRQNNE